MSAAAIFAPGLFSSSQVQLAAGIGAAVAIVAAAVGIFTVIRGQSFAAEALGDIGTAGGASAYLAGIGAIPGFGALTVLGATVMEIIGVQRLRGRDLATGVVLGAGFGLSALLLYLGTIERAGTGSVPTILFGSIFLLRSSDIPLTLALGGATLALLGIIHRPLLLASVSVELATARRLPVRRLGIGYLLAMAIAVALSALTVGSILSTALIVGPAAAALKLTSRPGRAVLTAAAIAIASVLIGIVLAYDSFTWNGRGWPASFFIVTLILIAYLVASLLGGRTRPGTR